MKENFCVNYIKKFEAVRPITAIKGVKGGPDCLEPTGIKFPEESFVFQIILKTFTPVGSGQSSLFFPPSTAVAHQINSAYGHTNSFTAKREAAHSSEYHNI